MIPAGENPAPAEQPPGSKGEFMGHSMRPYQMFISTQKQRVFIKLIHQRFRGRTLNYRKMNNGFPKVRV